MAAVMCLSSGACGSRSNEEELKIGTGNEGGTYYSFGNKIAEILSDDISVSVTETSGSTANIRLLGEEFVDIAIAQSDILESMSETDAGYSAIAALYTEYVQIVVKADSDIDDPEDLLGKKVSVGEEESGVLTNAKQILQVYGLTFENLDAEYLSFTESAEALKNGEIDAFFVTAGTPTSAIAQLAEDTEIKLLSLDEKEMERLQRLYGGYVVCEIPAGTYEGQDEDVTTVGVKAVLTARNSLSDEMVRKILGDVFEYADELGIAGNGYSEEDAVEGITIPFHNGAAAYYGEKGIDVEAGNNEGNEGVKGEQDD